MESYFHTENLAVGYNGQVLIDDINIQIEKGKILTLIGPNGAGKSTILKTITRHLERLDGGVFIMDQEISRWNNRQMAKQVAVVLTERIHPELLSCAEVVAMGRYPYTNMMGRMTPEDRKVIRDSLEQVHALDLAEKDFNTLSDGQKQRILLARAICQQPQIIVLDEPTAYLDIRYKIELLDILQKMARQQQITVILSLHEIDLATKVSDYMICVKGDKIHAFGTPEQIIREGTIESLYDLEGGSYDLQFGSVELSAPRGDPQVFVVSGGGCGIPCFRCLQKKGVPFAAGVLLAWDVDAQVAGKLSSHVILAEEMEPVTEKEYEKAAEILRTCRAVIDSGTPVGSLNRWNGKLLQLAREKKIPVYTADQLFSPEFSL